MILMVVEISPLAGVAADGGGCFVTQPQNVMAVEVAVAITDSAKHVHNH